MLLAVLLPGFSLYFNHRPQLLVWFTLMQLTLVGWPVAAVVAVRNLKRQRRKRRHS